MGDTLIDDTNPVVNGQKMNGDPQSQLQALEEKARKAQEAFEKEEKLRKELEEQNTKLTTERNALQKQLEGEKGSLGEYMEKSLKLAAQKSDLESQLQVSFYLLIVKLSLFFRANRRNDENLRKFRDMRDFFRYTWLSLFQVKANSIYRLTTNFSTQDVSR